MTKRKPTVLTTVEIDAQSDVASAMKKGKGVILTLHIDDDIVDFKGHFPQQPILPGVTQIDWAIYYAAGLLGAPTQFMGMEVIKFQNAILPNLRLQLHLSWLAEKNKLYFHYLSADGVHSSGRILLGENNG
ncbi:3-hydroxyacyl-ACP dehydratase [Aliivibrio kagoshimensis]|uniref:ApeI family dehydratase n=1 Tax=Aliivibrio kagoshimensis TaxID=2910230 RepID=UPI003D0A7FE9